MLNNVSSISPLLKQKAAAIQTSSQNVKQAPSTPMSPLLAKQLGVESYDPRIKDAVLAQNQQILKTQAVEESKTQPTEYKNNLKYMLTHNQSQMLAIIPRIMNAQDLDGNQLIQGNEISGNLVNASYASYSSTGKNKSNGHSRFIVCTFSFCLERRNTSSRP